MGKPKLLLALAIIAVGAVVAGAQVSTVDIVGRVLDPSGAVVAGAKVTAKNVDTGLTRETVASSSGDFAITLLPAGTYRVTVEAQGFATSVYEKLELLVGSKVTLEVHLKLGSARETVTVTEETPLLEFTRSEIAGSVSPLEVKELPILDRNFASLTYVVPGMRPAEGFDPTKSRVGNLTVNGSDGRALNVNVDGADNKDNVVGGTLQNFTIEGIQEFNVITNRYSAESGRALGAVVNVVSKSGTNTLHGSLFGLFQSHALNKIDFFSEQQGQPKPVYHRYHFGGSVGGPVIEDKFFFFGAYEHKREPGKIIVEPTAFRELQAFPLAEPTAQLATPYLDHQVTIKIDARMSDRHNASIRYGRWRWENPNDQLGNPFVTDLTQTQTNTNQFHDLNLEHNWSISPSKVNSFSIHFQDFVNAILASPDRTYTLNVQGGGTATNPEIFFPSGAEIGTNVNVPQQTLIRKYQLRDDFSWTFNQHTMKIGANYIYLAKLGGFFFFGASGYQIGFWDDPTVILANPTRYPQGFATPGAVQTLLFNGGNGNFNQRPHQVALYFQDDYKVTSRLTLNLGLRWDANIRFLPELLGDSATSTNRTIGVLRQVLAANPSSAAAAEGLARIRAIVGDEDRLRRTVPSWKEFQPRIGFAWDPVGSGKHVIRGGYGIAFDQVFQNLTLFALQQANPTIYQTIIDLANTARPGQCVPNMALTPQQDLCQFRFGVDALPAPAPGLTDLEFGAFGRINDPRMRDPYAQQWSVGWAWQFQPDFSFSADYYHVLGIAESRVQNINPKLLTLCSALYPGSTPSDPRCVRGADTRFFDAAFAAVPGVGAGRLEQTNMIGTTNRSRFDSVNFVLKKRFTNNYMFQASYILSRSVSWGGRPTASYSGNSIAVTPEIQFRANEFGPTIFDERSRFTASAHLVLPYGFEVSPVMQIASARPFSFRSGADTDGDGRVSIDRVCVGSSVSSPLIPGSNAPFGCEQVQVNSLRGDKPFQIDVRLAKLFKFKERMQFRIYYEVYNLTDTNNFGNNFGQNAQSSTFNQPLGYFGGQGFGPATSGPFRSQYGFRFEF